MYAKCKKCGNEWNVVRVPEGVLPKKCPTCKSVSWNKEKTCYNKIPKTTEERQEHYKNYYKQYYQKNKEKILIYYKNKNHNI